MSLRLLPLLCYIGNAFASKALQSQDEASALISKRDSLGTCVDLKILPLGASITWGTDSSTGDGYRGPLEKLILNGGNNVVFVGTRNNGDFADNAVEGYPGLTISQVAQKSQDSGSYDYQPNVVLIHLGTNDCIQNVDTAKAPTRMANLVQQLTTAIPNALIVVSNLIPNLDPNVEKCIQSVNSGLQDQATKLANSGTKIVFADMHSAVPTSDINTVDKTHPNDDGYQKMANVWYKVIGGAAKSIASPNAKGKVGYVQPQSLVQKCGAAQASSTTLAASAATSARTSAVSTSMSPSSTVPPSTVSSIISSSTRPASSTIPPSTTLSTVVSSTPASPSGISSSTGSPSPILSTSTSSTSISSSSILSSSSSSGPTSVSSTVPPITTSSSSSSSSSALLTTSTVRASSTSGTPTSTVSPATASTSTAATPTRTNGASSLAGRGLLNADVVIAALVPAMVFWILG